MGKEELTECDVCKYYGKSENDLPCIDCKHSLNTREKEEDLKTIRRQTLEKAIKCVCGERENEYGSPEDNFKTIAKMWNAYLGMEAGITATDVAMMMALLKIARIATGTAKEDSFVDLAGYAACGAEIAARKENNND